jgi:hypothetical protein
MIEKYENPANHVFWHIMTRGVLRIEKERGIMEFALECNNPRILKFLYFTTTVRNHSGFSCHDRTD